MLKDIQKALGLVKNPVSKESLSAEKRWIQVEMKGDELHLCYERSGIGPQEKREIEDSIVDTLAGLVSEDLIFIETQSSDSSDVYSNIGARAPKKSSNPAELKVGHGEINGKKRIPGIKQIVAIASGKGGVGKSTFTANLASTLKNMGRSVGVIDADIYGPSLPTIFGLKGQKPEATADKKIIPLEAYGVKVMSFGSFIEEDEPVVWRGPMLGGVLNQFLFDTDWGELDYLLIDLPPGTGDMQLSMVQNVEVDGSIIISTPQDIALADARKGLMMFNKMGVNVIGMVENMSSFICDSCDKEHFIFGTGGVTTACNQLGVGYLGKIPLEMALRKSADFGHPYMAQNKYEGRPIWNAYCEITEKLDRYFYPDDNKIGFFKKMFSKKD